MLVSAKRKKQTKSKQPTKHTQSYIKRTSTQVFCTILYPIQWYLGLKTCLLWHAVNCLPNLNSASPVIKDIPKKKGDHSHENVLHCTLQNRSNMSWRRNWIDKIAVFHYRKEETKNLFVQHVAVLQNHQAWTKAPLASFVSPSWALPPALWRILQAVLESS